MELGLSDLGARIRGALYRFITATGLRRRAFDYDCDSNASKEEGLGPGCSRGRKRKAPGEEREDSEESSPSFWKRFRAALGCGPGHGHVGHSYSPLPQSNRREERLKQLLQVPLIIQKVARSLSQADLLRLRSTCHLWHSVMSSELRRSHCPSVRVEGECALVVKRLGQLAGTLTSENGLVSSQMSKLTIVARRGSGSERTVFSHPRVRALFSVWGPGHLTRLSIRAESNMDNSWQYLYITGLRRVLFNLTPALVELRLSWNFTRDFRPVPAVSAEDGEDGWSWQELPRLRCLAMWWIGQSEDIAQLLRDLLRAATGLEALDQTLCAGTALRFLLSNPTASPSLSRLTVGSSFVDSELLGQVTELSARSPGGLRLTSLTGLSLSPRPAEVERLTSLLSLQAEYLTRLSLEFWDFGRGFGDPKLFTLPPLPALESLKIRANIGSLNFLRFSSAAYPNLKTLSLTYEPFAPPGAWAACLAGLAVSPVTDLTFYGELESVEVLEGLAEHFPGLTRLTISLRLECLPHIWEKWPELEFLDISLHGMRDEGEPSSLDEDLTGIGREQCVAIREQLARSEINFEQALTDLKTAPGLPDLKNLREFRLSFGYGSAPEESVLTDVSGYFAFAFAAPGSGSGSRSRLQRITFAGGKSNISDECRAAIRERLGLGSLIDI